MPQRHRSYRRHLCLAFIIKAHKVCFVEFSAVYVTVQAENFEHSYGAAIVLTSIPKLECSV